MNKFSIYYRCNLLKAKYRVSRCVRNFYPFTVEMPQISWAKNVSRVTVHLYTRVSVPREQLLLLLLLLYHPFIRFAIYIFINSSNLYKNLYCINFFQFNFPWLNNLNSRLKKSDNYLLRFPRLWHPPEFSTQEIWRTKSPYE